MVKYLILLLISVSCLAADEVVDITYANTVKKIFAKRCAYCHNAGWADKNYMSYPIAFRDRGKIVQRVFTYVNMPPSGMPFPERLLVKQWVDEGGKKQ